MLTGVLAPSVRCLSGLLAFPSAQAETCWRLQRHLEATRLGEPLNIGSADSVVYVKSTPQYVEGACHNLFKGAILFF